METKQSEQPSPQLREKLTLMPHQQKALEFVLKDHSCALFLDMGLGKTAVVLKAITQLLTDTVQFNKVLVIGPKRVVEETWPAEIRKWDAFEHVKFTIMPRGSKAWRSNKYHLYLISRDNIKRLCEDIVDARLPWPFDLTVIDELSSFKHRDSKRYQALKGMRGMMKKVIGMTGTPAANGYEDLWAQICMLDKGERLGRTISAYRQNYFYNANQGYATFPNYKLRPGAKEEIDSKIADICVSMETDDYVKLPECLFEERKLQLTPVLKERYQRFKKESILDVISKPDEPITAFNAAALANKLLQFCGGSVYDIDHLAHEVSDIKLEALKDLTEEANGQSVLIYYTYQYEFNLLKKAFPEARDIRAPATITAWNAGEVPVMLAHPASAGHGLNLQKGGHIMIWYNLTYDLELYMQACKRLHRIGQVHPVTIYHMTFNGCLDSHILNTVLKAKASLQNSLMEALKLK